MLAFLVKAVVGVVLDLDDDEVEAFVGTKSPESVLETIRISQATLAVVHPICANNTMDLASYSRLLQISMNKVVDRNVSVVELQHLMDMSPNPYFRASMSVVLQGLELIKYWQSLCDGSSAAANAWFENLVVCRLNLEKARKLISGTALIPYKHVEGAMGYSPVPSWYRPFGHTAWLRNGPRHSDPVKGFVTAALSAGCGKIILAGGALLAMIQGQWARDYDFWIVGCSNVQEAVKVVRDAARAAVSNILDAFKPWGMEGVQVQSGLTPNALTIVVQSELVTMSIRMQFMLRIFNDTEHVLTSFDLGPCCFALEASDTTDIFDSVRCTKRGQVALSRGLAFADPCQHSTPARAAMYDAKGFAFVLPVWGGDWRAKVLDPLSRMTMDELTKVAACGGARGILAFAHLRMAAGYNRKEHEDSEMGSLYECLNRPEGSFNPELQARFLARFSSLSAHTYEPAHHECFGLVARDVFDQAEARVLSVDDLLPDEPFQAASVVDGTRWSKDPAQGMHGAVGFYDGFD